MVRVLKVLYTACKLLGLIPFISVTSSRDSLIFNVSLFSAAYSSCLMLVINFVFLYSLSDWFKEVNHAISGIISTLHPLSALLSFLMGYYVSFVQYRKIKIAVGLVNLINLKVGYSSTAIYRTIHHVSCVKFLTMALSVTACCLVTWYYIRFITSSYLWLLSFLIIQLCIISTDFQFHTFVTFLKQHLIQINDQLNSFSNSCITQDLHISPHQSAAYKLPHVTRVTVISPKNHMKPQTPSTISSSPHIPIDTHGYICDLAEVIGSIYAPFLLSSITTDFLFLSYALHVFLSKIISPSVVINYLHVTAYIWGTFYAVKSMYLIYVCSSAKVEVSPSLHCAFSQ
jgi:hypothetical protein